MDTPLFLVIQSLLGIAIFVAFAWFFSEDRKKVDFKAAAQGLGVQVLLAFLITSFAPVRHVFFVMSQGIEGLKEATMEATSFIFGYLGGGNLPFEVKEGASTFIFVFQPLPMIMVVSAISMLLFHWGILPWVVQRISWFFQKTLKVGGALGVGLAAKVFLGQTDAPLLIRPYLSKISRGELFTIMVAGMATTSASIMVLYADVLRDTIEMPLSHILTASVISIPAALTLSRIVVPHGVEATEGEMATPYFFSGSVDAIAQGATDGMKLFWNIVAMLLVMMALVALLNKMLLILPEVGGAVLTLDRILGWILFPVTWLMGIPAGEALTAASLIGLKTMMNEYLAFVKLSQVPAAEISPRTSVMMAYALCGFANFGSIGIQIGGLGMMAPDRRNDIISLSVKALIVGTLSSCLSGSVMGVLYLWNG